MLVPWTRAAPQAPGPGAARAPRAARVHIHATCQSINKSINNIT